MGDDIVGAAPSAPISSELREDVAALVARYGIAVGIVGGGHQSGMLMSEAFACYVRGLFVATLLCAHATCERELAGRVASLARPPAGADRWGLGRLLGYATEQRWYAAETLKELDRLNERRRDLYHLQGQPGMGELFRRTYDKLSWRGKHHIAEDMYSVLRVEALESLNVALAVRSELLAGES